MKVKNRRCIRNLSLKQFRAAKTRNMIAIFAIALTTLLFTSLFTIALSINSSYQEYTFRQIGGYCHGSFKDLTEDKIQAIAGHNKIKEYGLRTVIGFATEEPFAKVTAEISYMDPNITKWSYAMPTTGRMPEKGLEIAMDTGALYKLGISAKLGEQVQLTYDSLGMGNRTETFTLVGFWEYDALMPVHYLNVSEEYMRKIEGECTIAGGEAFRTDMAVMLGSSMNIWETLESIDTDLGYQWQDREADNCVRFGENWGYTMAELNGKIDPTTIIAVVSFLLLIVFSGYLIIYNIFQISISNDIRFYGMLKTIGTTPGQLKRIVYLQALYLAGIGIPLGCVLGYGVGAILSPIIIASTSLSGVVKISASPLIFGGAALFSLLTVLFSCARPGKKAASITPVEAVRYTEAVVGRRKKREGRGAKIWQMALANLGRNSKKTWLVILSLSLAVVLLNCVFLFVNGFDAEKFVDSYSNVDFVVGTTDYFNYCGEAASAAIADGMITEIEENITASVQGGGYTISSVVNPKCTLEIDKFQGGIDPEYENWMEMMGNRVEDGLLEVPVQLEGLDDGLLQKLTVYEGSLEPLKDPKQHGIALAVTGISAVGNDGESYSSICQVGDTLTISYGEYVDSRTGEAVTEETPYEYWEMSSHDVTYTVCALVDLPYALSYRFTITPCFQAVITSEALMQDSNMKGHRMFYAFDTMDLEAEEAAEAFLSEYTKGEYAELMYESKALLRGEIDNFGKMFLLVGTVLCGIVGLVGILNFFNAILTGIMTRHREFAMLQSVGMTGKQLKQMLVLEGVFYAVGSGALTLILALLLNVPMGKLGGIFWYFTYHFTILPVFIVIPVFVALGILMPLMIYRHTAKKSIVERLRESE